MTATSRHLSSTHPPSLTAIYNHLLPQLYHLTSTVHPLRLRSSHLQPPPPPARPTHRHLPHPLLLLTSPQTRPPHQTARKQLRTDKEKKESGLQLEPHRRKGTSKTLPNQTKKHPLLSTPNLSTVTPSTYVDSHNKNRK